MVVTLSGIVTEDSLLQFLKKPNMDVVPLGILIDVKLEQPSNAQYPIVVTVSGIWM